MYLLRWLWEGFGHEEVAPSVVYWTLRVLMLTLSIVLEDWAILELFQSPRARRVVVPLIASSYVTWTFQTHTFSNSLETLLVLWSLVLIRRITEDKVCSTGLRRLWVSECVNSITEPVWRLCIVHSWFPGRCGNLQPHHLSSVFAVTFILPYPSLPAQVS